MRIVILPGWQHTTDDWEQVATILKSHGHQIQLLTLPGFGEEPLPTSINTMNQVADWLEQKLAPIPLDESIILCGHSYGGRLAVTLAARKKIPISKMILVGSPNLYRPTLSIQIKKIVVGFAKPFRRLIPHKVRDKLRSEDYRKVRNTPLARLYKDVLQTSQDAELSECGIPTLVICGDRDEAVSISTAKEITSLLPYGKLQVLKETGHNIHFENPSLLAGIVHTYATHS